MKRVVTIQQEVGQVSNIKKMTSVFEAIASIHIAEIKDQVVSSTAFFHQLWNIYTQIRLGKEDFASHRKPAITDRIALMVVTSDGGLIGDIDDRIVTAMLNHPELSRADVFVVGAHGINLLARKGMRPAQSFALPTTDENIQVNDIAAVMNQYQQATVYYQTYISLLHQEVARIDLFSAVAALGQQSGGSEEVISSQDYIFEPSLNEIVSYLESVMLEIALGQIILESKLAQYASRFNAMTAAKTKANEMEQDLLLNLHRAKRSQGDERIREVLGGMKVLRGGGHGG